MKHLFCIGLLVPCLSLLACGGGGGGPTGPTEPPVQKSVMVLDTILASFSSGGMEDGKLFLDGREVFHRECNPAVACQLAATLSGITRGAHTVSILLVRQNRTSVTYVVLGQVDFVDSTGSRSFPLEQRTVTLRAGDTVTYNISL
jgi:hypothetical protein